MQENRPREIILKLLRAKKAMKAHKPGTVAHTWANELNRSAWTEARKYIEETNSTEKTK